jgi:hypothetical protein
MILLGGMPSPQAPDLLREFVLVLLFGAGISLPVWNVNQVCCTHLSGLSSQHASDSGFDIDGKVEILLCKIRQAFSGFSGSFMLVSVYCNTYCVCILPFL